MSPASHKLKLLFMNVFIDVGVSVLLRIVNSRPAALLWLTLAINHDVCFYNFALYYGVHIVFHDSV